MFFQVYSGIEYRDVPSTARIPSPPRSLRDSSGGAGRAAGVGTVALDRIESLSWVWPTWPKGPPERLEIKPLMLSGQPRSVTRAPSPSPTRNRLAVTQIKTASPYLFDAMALRLRLMMTSPSRQEQWFNLNVSSEWPAAPAARLRPNLVVRAGIAHVLAVDAHLRAVGLPFTLLWGFNLNLGYTGRDR